MSHKKLQAAKMDFRHYLERAGSNIKDWANRHGKTDISIHRLFNPNHEMVSEPLRRQIALHMGKKTWDEFINQY